MGMATPSETISMHNADSRRLALVQSISAPHQLASQRFNRVPEALVAGHVEQFIDDLLQRRRLNMTPEGLCNFRDRIVGRRHARIPAVCCSTCIYTGLRRLSSPSDPGRASSPRQDGAPAI